MRGSLIRTTGNPDYWLITIVAALCILGAILVYSAAPIDLYMGRGPVYTLVQHLIRLAIGLVALLVMSRVDYHILRRWPLPLVIAGIAVALLVVLRIVTHGGDESSSIRWFFNGPLGQSIQPSELAKPAVIIYMAAWLASKGENVKKFTYGFVPFLVLVGFMTALILAQPNLSTAIVIASTAIAMFFVGGADLKQLFLLFAIAGAGAPVIAYDYMRDRVEAWYQLLIHPAQIDLTGINRQPIETTTALAAGKIAGVGLGGGQHKLYLGAMAHTDLIMAVAGEELGLVGTLLILSLFVGLTYRGIKIALAAPDTFGTLLATGITFWIMFQALVHAAVVSQTIPVTGMALPFISYGGSALLMEMAGIGILINISKQAARESGLDNARFAFGRRDGRARLSHPRHS